MNTKSVYKFAAEAGMPVGLYLTLMSACLLLSLRFSFLPVLLLPLAVGFPFFLAHFLKDMVRQQPAYRKFFPLWLCGIYSIIFGTLICSLLSSLYLIFVEPGFVSAYVNNAIATIEASPMAPDYASTTALMRQALDSHMLPTGMELVISMGWSTCFGGSMLSMILAMILSRGKRQTVTDMWR